MITHPDYTSKGCEFDKRVKEVLCSVLVTFNTGHTGFENECLKMISVLKSA
jgi:hypothetical protein